MDPFSIGMIVLGLFSMLCLGPFLGYKCAERDINKREKQDKEYLEKLVQENPDDNNNEIMGKFYKSRYYQEQRI